MLLLEVILSSLNDHFHVADLLALVQYINTDAPLSPDRKNATALEVSDDKDEVLLKLKTSETLMKMLLRNIGFFTVS